MTAIAPDGTSSRGGRDSYDDPAATGASASTPGVGPSHDRAESRHPWWHPSTTVQRGLGAYRTATGAYRGAADIYRRMEKRLARQPLARLGLAAPRTARFAAGELVRPHSGGTPSARVTPALLGHVVMDESIMAIAVGPNRFPRRADYIRVGEELRRAHDLFTERGWLDDPASYHREPPPLVEPATTRGWALGTTYERLLWPSGYEPHLGVPGTDRWLAFEANRTASAWVLRHRDRNRPWIVCVHGFGTGTPFMDLFSFRTKYLHHDLGLNVATLVLPVHGSRRPSRFSGEEFLGFEFMNSVHGLTQSVWDLRRLLSWVRLQEPEGLGVFGVSLGGMVASLLAAFDDELDLVLAGIPVVDFPELIKHHAPRNLQMRSIEHHILDGTAQEVHRVVSPLSMPVAAKYSTRAIFAGLGDRLVTTAQARRLWEHWDEPETCWFQGNHVGYLWSDAVWTFVTRSLEERGLTA